VRVQETQLDGDYVSARGVGDRVYVVVRNAFNGLPAPEYHVVGDENVYETEAEYRARIQALPLDVLLPQVSAPADIYWSASAAAGNLVTVSAFDVTATASGPVQSLTIQATYYTTLY